MTEKEALLKLQKICSQQEKCRFDINRKLMGWKIPENQTENILKNLMDNKFIDELRYSKSFVRDKFRFNGWGKIKLTYALRQKKIGEEIIQDALTEIDESAYHTLAVKLLRKKSKSLKRNDINIIRAKLIKFAQSKGFEYSVIQKALQTVINEDFQK